MQHMVQAVELMGALNGFYIPRGFHHADHGAVPFGGSADAAHLVGGIILAKAAAVQLDLGVFNRLGQLHGLLIAHGHYLIGHAHGTLAANAGEPGKLVRKVFKGFGVLHAAAPGRGYSCRRSF